MSVTAGSDRDEPGRDIMKIDYFFFTTTWLPPLGYQTSPSQGEFGPQAKNLKNQKKKKKKK